MFDGFGQIDAVSRMYWKIMENLDIIMKIYNSFSVFLQMNSEVKNVSAAENKL